ncbi:Zinc finger protein SNAI1 [Armadillidium nasatum]|uniref:Zinc finger protein SNAI1 n=1 Tax=Armadillidium nasatum TaxID=96803 RepID=A0A5N5T9E2_9CRUS|nr:Zinc finger protein SNAI1 [Armadillidium nasatum]
MKRHCAIYEICRGKEPCVSEEKGFGSLYKRTSVITPVPRRGKQENIAMYHRFHEAKLSQDAEMSHEQTQQGTPPPPVPVTKVDPVPPTTNSPSTSSGGSNGSGGTPGVVVTSGDTSGSVLITGNSANEPVVTDLTLAQAHKRTLVEFSMLEREANLVVAAPLQFKIKEEEFRSSPPDHHHQHHIHSAMSKLTGKEGCHRMDSFSNLEGHPPPSYAALAQSAALDVLQSVSQGKALLQDHSGANAYTILSTPEVIHDEPPPTRRGRKASHGGVGPFLCAECGTSFSAASNLKAHLRLHTGEKPFECPICFMSFAQKSNLRAHEITHSDVKPFSCPDCPSTFKQKANLRTHVIKKHNGATPLIST